MNYYILKNRITITEADMSNIQGVIILNEEQIDFLLNNEGASIEDILRCEIKISTITLEEMKDMAIKMVSSNYTAMIDSNFDSVLPAPVWSGFENHGYEKCTNAVAWTMQRSDERYAKIQAIKNATTIEELQAIPLDFTDKQCPVSTEELFYEIVMNRN
jgi:hypothetical protein